MRKIVPDGDVVHGRMQTATRRKMESCINDVDDDDDC